MKFFSASMLVMSLCIGNCHIYARDALSLSQIVSKARAVSAQFYREIGMLTKNLAEAERVLYANHRVEEKLLRLLAQVAIRPSLPSSVSVPPHLAINTVLHLGDGKEIDLGTQDPQPLLEAVAGKDFITALQDLQQWYQQRLQRLQEQGAYRVDFGLLTHRTPYYDFMLHDKEAVLLKQNAAKRILTALGVKPAWETPTPAKQELEEDIGVDLIEAVLKAKIESADFYHSLASLTQEFLHTEQELFREYKVSEKINAYLLWKGIEGEFYGGTISSIARDGVKSHDLLAAAVGPEYIAELEALYTDYLDKAAELPFFEEHAEHTRLWEANYTEMFFERHIAFKLKGHVVDNLVIALKSTAIPDKNKDDLTLRP